MKSRGLGTVVVLVGVLLLLGGAGWWSGQNFFAGGKTISAAGTGEAAGPLQNVSPGSTGFPACGPDTATAKPLLAQDYGRLPLYFIENRGQVDQQVKYYARGNGHTTFFTRDGVVLTLARNDGGRETEDRGKIHPWSPVAGPGGKEQREEGDRSGPWHRGKFGDRFRRSPLGDSPAIDNPQAALSWTAGFFAPLGVKGAPAGGRQAGRSLWPAPAVVANASEPVVREDSPRPVQYSVVRMQPVGMQKKVKIKALEPQEGKVNYFIGNNPKKWRTNIPTYAGVLYQDAYAGIDLKFYGHGRELEYDVVVKPGADPGQVRFAYEGVKELRVTAAGDLALVLPDGGELIQKKPYVYQEIAGQRVPRDGRFRVAQDTARLTCGFQVAAYDPAQLLVIDPVLVYSTYLGGSGWDRGQGIAVDPEGNAYITGNTPSFDFPTLNPIQVTLKFNDAFVTKLTAAGAMVYSTFLGGNDSDFSWGIAVDLRGTAFITGDTSSVDFPTLNPFQETKKGYSDAFVTSLTAAGTLAYSTYLGGSHHDCAHGIAADSEGNAYITGETQSNDFPILNPFQGTLKGTQDAFVTRLASTGALASSTYVGGSSTETGYGIFVDTWGNAYITGITCSNDFPNFDPVQVVIKKWDVFVTKLTTTGDLPFSTCLGGSDNDYGGGITVDASGNVYIVGVTWSADFPTLNPLQKAIKGGGDAFVTKLTDTGVLFYSTYLGGKYYDEGLGIAVDSGGNAYITGSTESFDFPSVIPFQGGRGAMDAFVARLTASGALDCSTFLGGSFESVGKGIAMDSASNIYIAGYTKSFNFPLKNPFQGERKGWEDAFVTKISFGSNTPILPLLLED